MRNVNIYLLKILLLVGLFIGCDGKENPPRPQKLPEREVIPPGTAIFRGVLPKNNSRLIFRHYGLIHGVILRFNKKTYNFKTDPPLEFCAIDEIKSTPNLKTLEVLRSRIDPLDTCIYVKVPSSKYLARADPSWKFEASWGPEPLRRVVRLEYYVFPVAR